MKRISKLSLAAASLWLAAVTLGPTVAAANPKLTIGSKAPALDIEHWIQDGEGYFDPVTDFEPGHVYVVEFWATWCAPCISSMPHLAELQKQYRGQQVQIVSISDESLEEVEALLERENEDLGLTFAEITSAYSLTTDPDGSSHVDFMEAANQASIPTSFIVGKTGQIEWIGHPMEIDDPLEQVVADTWDRDAFKKELLIRQRREAKIQKMNKLAGAGEFEGAIELAAELVNETDEPRARARLENLINSMKLSSGKIDDGVLAYYRGKLKEMAGRVEDMLRYGYSLYGVVQEGGSVGPLAKEAIAALREESDELDDDLRSFYFNTIALLHTIDNDFDAAIAAQKKAIAAADERQKERLELMLEKMRRDAEASADTTGSKR